MTDYIFPSYLSILGGTIFGNLTVTGDVTVQGNLNFGDVGTDILTIAGYMQGSAAGTTYLRVGNSTTSHALAATNDLLVSGKLEVDGAAFADSTLTVAGALTSSTSTTTPIVDSGAASALTLKTNAGTSQVLINHTASATRTVNLTGSNGGNPAISASAGNLAIASGWTAASQTCADLGSVTTADINGGTIDGAAIGSSATSTGAFTTVTATSIALGGGTALANYVQGTFSPTVTLVGGAGNTVPQYSTNTGRYTRIGNRVFASVLLSGDGGNEGAGTGTFNVNLPITANASSPDRPFMVGTYINGATTSMLAGIVTGSATTISLVKFTAITTYGGLTGADQNSTTREVRLEFCYEV